MQLVKTTNQIATTEPKPLTQIEVISIRSEFADLLSDNIKNNTKRSYRNALTNTTKTGFLDISEKYGINYIEYPIKAVLNFIEVMLDNGKSINTIKIRIAAIYKAYDAIGIYHVRKEPLIKEAVKSAKNKASDMQVEAKQAKAIELDDFKDIIRSIDASTNKGKRDKAILLIGMYCGLRRSEIVGLKKDNVLFKDGKLKITLKNTKTDKERKGQDVFIESASNKKYCAILALTDWLKVTKDCESVFTSINRYDNISCKPLTSDAIGKLVKKHLGTEFSGHSLRVSIVCILAKLGFTIEQISRITRHKDARMITHYAKQVKGFENTLSFV